jgi:hypothetical protein
MANLPLILEVFALVFFAFAAWIVIEPYRWRLVPAGLFCLTLAMIVGGLHL